MKYAIGIMCGTSADALDAALISVDEEVRHVRVECFHSQKLSRKWQALLQEQCDPKSSSVADICDLNIRLAQDAAQVVSRLLAKSSIVAEQIDVIGYHGHTVYHAADLHPVLGKKIRSTLQIGDGPTLAELTGIPVVNNFRTKDLVHGGCGAPLVPFAHARLFGSPGKRLAIHNLGGISNVTYLSDALKLGFDTGPANMLLDGLMQRLYGRLFDRDGRVAAKGKVHERVVAHFMKDPFLRRRPPKSTGREFYGRAFLEKWLRETRRHGLTKPDNLATALEFTARSMEGAYVRFIFPRGLDEVILCGGGARNPVLVKRLSELLKVPLKTSADYGIDPQQVEAVSFALLGYLALHRCQNQFGELTGSTRNLSLGQIAYPG